MTCVQCTNTKTGVHETCAVFKHVTKQTTDKDVPRVQTPQQSQKQKTVKRYIARIRRQSASVSDREQARLGERVCVCVCAEEVTYPLTVRNTHTQPKDDSNPRATCRLHRVMR